MLVDATFSLLYLISLALLVLKLYALVDCLRQPAGAFVAHGKLSKPAWVAITAASAGLQLLVHNPLSGLSLIGDVASIVYLVDVKPAVSGT